MERLGRRIPASGLVHVRGVVSRRSSLRPLDFAPVPDRAVRGLFEPEAISAEVERLIARQQDDGGWPVDFANYSPAAALEWRGHMTGCALSILRPNHKIQAADWAASSPASRR